MGWNFIFSKIRDDTQNGSTVETVAAEAGKDKNNKEGQVLILFMKTEPLSLFIDCDFPEMEKRGMGGLFQINPVTKTGQRLYMVNFL